MTIEQAIKKAIEAGMILHSDQEFASHYNVANILLDPAFWQSLGKAMGWNDSTLRQCGLTPEGVSQFRNTRLPPNVNGQIVGESRDGKCWSVRWEGKKYASAYHKDFIKELSGDWRQYWHRFIDHLAAGKSVETFFETLK